jgi:long-subunit fatty acid transport protein
VFNPRKTINFGIGANYKHNEDLQLRGGFYYQAAALPESSFDLAFVDLPRYAATVGIGYALTKSLGLDASYNAVFFHSRSINAPDGTGGSSGYTGSFSSFGNIVSASLTYRMDAHL